MKANRGQSWWMHGSQRFILPAVFLWFLSFTVAQAADGQQLVPVDSSAATLPSLSDPQTGFEFLAALPADERSKPGGQLIALDIDLENSPGFTVGTVDGAQEIRYRMAFNNIAEGWNWYPLADPQGEDYYHAKFLPLKSVTVERGEYDHQDKIGETQRMKITWRYDYFLAFENLYDFYPRAVDDDSGFVATLPATEGATITKAPKELQVRMLALATLVAPYVAESSTFWKATYGKPTDFTLKKRYLTGRLEAVWFVDAASGRVLARLLPRVLPR